MKDIDDEYMIISNKSDKIDFGKKLSDEQFLKYNDILLSAKSNNFTASVYKEKNILSVASSQFLILGLLDNSILPEYLTWYLNNEKSQKYFQINAIGTNIKVINKKILENLEIEIPDKKSQEFIVKIHKLQLREMQLLKQITTQRRKLINTQLLKIVDI